MRRYPKKSNSSKSFLLAATVIILLVLVSIIVNICLRPIIFDMGRQAGKYSVYETINETVNDLFADQKIDYGSLVEFIYSNDGYVSAVEYNYSSINSLKLECSRKLTDNLYKLRSSKIKVPLGNLFGDINMQGRGPKLRFKLSQISVPDVQILSVFEVCGINQTKHEIRLIIGASAQIYLPPHKAEFTCTQEYILASTIIVGDIPDGYAVIN